MTSLPAQLSAQIKASSLRYKKIALERLSQGDYALIGDAMLERDSRELRKIWRVRKEIIENKGGFMLGFDEFSENLSKKSKSANCYYYKGKDINILIFKDSASQEIVGLLIYGLDGKAEAKVYKILA